MYCFMSQIKNIDTFLIILPKQLILLNKFANLIRTNKFERFECHNFIWYTLSPLYTIVTIQHNLNIVHLYPIPMKYRPFKLNISHFYNNVLTRIQFPPFPLSSPNVYNLRYSQVDWMLCGGENCHNTQRTFLFFFFSFFLTTQSHPLNHPHFWYFHEYCARTEPLRKDHFAFYFT